MNLTRWCYFVNKAIQLINEKFNYLVILRNDDNNTPPRSPDLPTLEYFLTFT